jgi:predicted TPR repeat methyltransferase
MDFEAFYDKQADYTGFRNDPGKQEDYRITVDWKARELAGLVSGDRFRNILEVGCALGVLLNNISDKLEIGKRTGVDISGENIRTASKLFPGCRFYRGTLEEFIADPEGIKNEKFDLVVLSDILEHIPDDIGLLREVRKIAKCVLVNLPLEKAFRNRNRKYGEEDPSGHLRCYDNKMAIQLFTDAGFEIVRSRRSIATRDKSFFQVYRKNRNLRLGNKPLFLKLGWKGYYATEDKLKLLSRRISEKIYGSNYFALLKPGNS